MRPTQYIFHFENCESVSATPEQIDHLELSGVTKSITLTPEGSSQRRSCGYMSMLVDADAMFKRVAGPEGQDAVPAERLLANDLVAIDIDTGKKIRRIYMPWQDRNEAGDINALQRSVKRPARYQITIGRKTSLSFLGEGGDA